MTELEKAANEFAGVNYDCEDEGDSFYHMIQKEAFIAGAEWAINKICEYLRREYEDIGIRYVRGGNVEEEIEELRKFVEE